MTDRNESPDDQLNEYPVESFNLDDIFLMQFSESEEPKMYMVTDINQTDKHFTLTNQLKEEEIYYINFNEAYEIIRQNDDYEIYDLIRVKELKKDSPGRIEDFKIDTEIVDEKETIYSDELLKDDLLSQLIQSYNCYDKPYLIRLLTEQLNHIMSMQHDLKYPKYQKKNISWLIPITDDTMKLYNHPVDKDTMTVQFDHYLGTELNDEIESIERGYPDYHTMINSHLKHCVPLLNNNSVGYITNEYCGKFLRNCIQSETCYGINGNYSYDERKTGEPITTSSLIINEKKEYLSESVERVSVKPLNIIGYLQEPMNKNIYSFNSELVKQFTLYEKCLLNKLYELKQNQKRKVIGKMKIMNHLIDTDTLKIEPMEDVFISHTFNRKMNHEDLEQTLLNNLPSSEDILQLLISKTELSTKILNFQNIQQYLYKYDIQLSELTLEERKIIHNLISKNVKAYIQNYIRNVKKKLTKPFKTQKKITTIQDKIKLSLEYIYALKNENEKMNLLSQFIDVYTRKADKISEDSNFLYSKTDDKKIMCCHYLYSIQSKNENDIFQTMISLFGSSPEDGSIHCRNCGEVLCREEESSFDGFDANNNVQQTKETLSPNQNDALEQKNLLEKKEDLVNYIRLLSTHIGVAFTDEDIYHILLLYDNMNQDELAELRYSMKNVSDSDIHPYIQERVKKLDPKDKKKYKKDKVQIIKDFQKYLKSSNKLLMLLSLLTIYIQTNLPAFQIKKTLLFRIMDFHENKIIEEGAMYITEKIKNMCVIYQSDSFWKHGHELLNEKSTSFINQYEKTLRYCTQSKFMKLKERIKLYVNYLHAKKSIHYKQEWTNFKPLQKNSMITKISTYLNQNLQKEYLIKSYNSYKIENISLLRDLFSEQTIPDLLDIEQVSILNNQSFKHIFRYAVACYGKTSTTIYMNLTFNRLLKTSDKSNEILKILKKYQWNEELNGFKLISFFDIRRSIIPEILHLYNSENNNLEACYQSGALCNNFIHVLINNFDLKMLNAFPKRHYHYRAPLVYPNQSFKELNKELIDKIFMNYHKNSLGLIRKYTSSENYLNKYLIHLQGDIDEKRFESEKTAKLIINDENYKLILESIRHFNALPYHEIIKQRDNYTNDDYQYLDSLSNWNTLRFISYLGKYPTPTNELVSKSIHSPSGAQKIFSNIITLTEQNMIQISSFISQSDDINDKQKKRFGSIYKNYDTSQKVIFRSEQITKILQYFFIDEEFKTDLVVNYLNDIQSIFIRIINHSQQSKQAPKEWNLTDSIRDTYLDDYQNRNLYLHHKIFLKSKDNYQGFNTYIDHSIYIQSLYLFIKDIFLDLDMIQGNPNSIYNERYSRFYSHYLLSELFIRIIEYINGLKDEKSDIATDANELFLSLEKRDDDMLNHSIEICSQFLMDLVTHLLLAHYDTSWLYLCGKEMELTKGLSKQKEKEKQNLIEELDKAGKDKDELFVKQELNKTGQSQYWKEASQKYSEFTKTEEHATMSDNERKDRFKEIFGEISIDTEEIHISLPKDEANQELGYEYYEDKDDEDDETDNLDEEQDTEFNV